MGKHDQGSDVRILSAYVHLALSLREGTARRHGTRPSCGAIRDGACDGVAIGRPLIANNCLPKILRQQNGPAAGKECTYCNKCLMNDLENPLGCYELSRYDGSTFEEKWENMIKEVMSVFYPPTFT